jgi:hypothetical protein
MAGKYKGKKWEVATEASWKFDFEHAKAHQDLYNVNWNSALGVQKSKGGSQGVYFVDTPDGAVVVKGSNSLGAEMFCFSLAVKCGIPAPKCRIVARESEEGQLIYSKLIELDDRQPLYRTVRQALYRTFLLLQEYCTGSKSLSSLGDDKLSQIIWKAKDKGQELLQIIGRIAAFDMFLRNTDRFPLAVDNRGNPGNVMFDNSGRVFSIDNCSMCIDIINQDQQAKHYAESVAKYLKELSADPTALHKNTTRLQANILQYTEYDIEERGTMFAQEGILQFVQILDSISFDDLIQLKETIAAFATAAGKDEVVGLDAVRLSFLGLMLDIFHKRGDVDIDERMEFYKKLDPDSKSVSKQEEKAVHEVLESFNRLLSGGLSSGPSGGVVDK